MKALYMNEGDYPVEIHDATVECNIHFSTRYLLSLLWRRVRGLDSTSHLRIFANRTFFILK